MSIIIRKQTPPPKSDWRDYKPYLRPDFNYECAYCRIPERHWGGPRNFVVEHFRPRSLFPSLALTYANLYYACNRCNDFKRDTWPPDELYHLGYRFADPCEEDVYLVHLMEEPDGFLIALTCCGAYTRDHVRLNRWHLKDWRSKRRAALDRIRHVEELRKQALETLESLPEPSRALVASVLVELDTAIQDLRDRYISPTSSPGW